MAFVCGGNSDHNLKNREETSRVIINSRGATFASIKADDREFSYLVSNMKTIALTLVLLCTVVSLAQSDGKAGSNSCNPYMFKDCCYMPQLISRDVFDQCLKDVGGRSKILFEKFKARIDKKKSAARAARKGVTTTVAPTRGKRSADDSSSPICMMNCVLEKQGMMKNGNVLVSEIKKIFGSKTNNSYWLPILDSAVTKCDADLANYNKDKFCASNRDSLKTCNPFFVDNSVANKQSAAFSKKSQGKKKQGASAGQAKKGGSTNAAAQGEGKNKKSGVVKGKATPPPKAG
ncbi:hypothetical protein B566_EDAN009476 [Ephemera danica]|nr:hypothetical protein B566_EDAN009476 [Ephemera danica]